MASFVGIVTQKDLKTGLVLRAKVTSPKGNYSAYQDFKCMVKPTGLSDLQAVLLDLATVTNSLMAAGVVGISSNLTKYMPLVGVNGTSIVYESTITDYLSNDGIVKKRPNYGTADQTGTLKITVSKGLETAIREINISVAQYSEAEIVNSTISAITWDAIRGSNASAENGGMDNVSTPLNLIDTIPTTGSDAPIAVVWSITQDVTQGVFAQPRIDIATGSIYRPTYTATIGYLNDGSLSGVNAIITKLSGYNVVRISGLKITAKVTLGMTTKETTFTLKTLSQLLTNTEVASYLVANASIINAVTNEMYLSANNEPNRIYNINTVPTQLMLFTPASIALNNASQLFGVSGNAISVNSVDWTMVDMTDQITPITLPAYTTGITQVTDSNFQQIEFTALPPAGTSDEGLSLKCSISVSAYSGSAQIISGYWKINLKQLVA